MSFLKLFSDSTTATTVASVPIFSTADCVSATRALALQLDELGTTGVEIPLVIQQQIVHISAQINRLYAANKSTIDAGVEKRNQERETSELQTGASFLLLTMWGYFWLSMAEHLRKKKLEEFGLEDSLEDMHREIYDDIDQCLVEINKLLIDQHRFIFPPLISSIKLSSTKLKSLDQPEYGFIHPPVFTEPVELLSPEKYVSRTNKRKDGYSRTTQKDFVMNYMMKCMLIEPKWSTEFVGNTVYEYLNKMNDELCYSDLIEGGLANHIILVDPFRYLSTYKIDDFIRYRFSSLDLPNFFE